MKVKVLKPFRDKENDLVFRDIGEEIEVSTGRGKELIEKGFGAEVGAAEEKPKRGRKPKA